MEADRFRWLAGESQLIRFESSAEAQRGFCGTCGTTLLFESERWQGEVHIARATVTSEVQLVPAAHAFFDDRADWVHHGDDGLLRLGGPSGTEPIETG